MIHGPYAKLHAVGFGFALGIVSAIFVFITGLFAIQGFAVEYVRMMGTIYVGYGPTFLGALLGAIWAFIGGFIMGVIIAAIYNCFSCGHCRHCGACKDKMIEKPGVDLRQ